MLKKYLIQFDEPLVTVPQMSKCIQAQVSEQDICGQLKQMAKVTK